MSVCKKPFVVACFVLLCSRLALSHMSYDSFALRQIREKFEKKIDTNYFLHSKAARQQSTSVQCSSEDGPYCSFVNKKTIIDNIELNNTEYIIAKNGALGEILRKSSGEVIYQTMRQNERGSDFLFFDNTREIMDELLYPQLFSRASHFIFTFETFERGKQEKRADRVVHYDVDRSRFNSYLYPFLKDDLIVHVNVSNVWVPAAS